MDWEYTAELFLGGLTRGSIYALIALGYTMVYGIMKMINFAHGEIYMIGAFTSFIVATVLSIYGFPLLSIVVLAGLAGAARRRRRRALLTLPPRASRRATTSWPT